MLCSPKQVPANLYVECPASEDGPISTVQGKENKKKKKTRKKRRRRKGGKERERKNMIAKKKKKI